MKEKVFGVIPARLQSTRFPRKPLAVIAGQTMISRVITRVQKAKKITKVVVATDSHEIEKEAKLFGAEVVMTDPDLPSGTDRVYHAVKSEKPDLVINIQGDEPTIHPEVIDQLVESLLSDVALEVSTLGQNFKSLEEFESLNNVKAVVNAFGEALYFSRFPVPCSRVDLKSLNFPLKDTFKHIGIYGYKFSFLEKFCQTASVFCEQSESLEQLRALYLGAKIKVIPTHHSFLGVDVPEDVQKVENWIRQNGWE